MGKSIKKGTIRPSQTVSCFLGFYNTLLALEDIHMIHMNRIMSSWVKGTMYTMESLSHMVHMVRFLDAHLEI